MAISDELLNKLAIDWNRTMKQVREETKDAREIYFRASCELYELLLKLSAQIVDTDARIIMSQLLGDYETIMDIAGVDYVAYKMEMPSHHTLCEPGDKVYSEHGTYCTFENGDDFLDG